MDPGTAAVLVHLADRVMAGAGVEAAAELASMARRIASEDVRVRRRRRGVLIGAGAGLAIGMTVGTYLVLRRRAAKDARVLRIAT